MLLTLTKNLSSFANETVSIRSWSRLLALASNFVEKKMLHFFSSSFMFVFYFDLIK